MVCQDLEKPLQHRGADFLRRHHFLGHHYLLIVVSSTKKVRQLTDSHIAETWNRLS